MSLRDIFAGMLRGGGGGGGADASRTFEDLLREEQMRTGGGGGAGESARDRAAKRYNLSRKGIVSSAYPGTSPDATKVASIAAPAPAAPAALPAKTDIIPTPRPDAPSPARDPSLMWESPPPNPSPVRDPSLMWPGATAGTPPPFEPGANTGPPPIPLREPDVGTPIIGASRVMPPVPGTDVPQGGSWYDTGVRPGKVRPKLKTGKTDRVPVRTSPYTIG